jgi:D-beta-D-heptose 7-phosphate kinase/D-beta-D-heptose 1-phosphate adenosyltransferase
MKSEMFPSLEERRKLKQIPRRFKDRRILVIGDLMLDHYIRGSVNRLSPEAPVPIVQVKEESFVPGGAGNVAANLSALLGKVEIIGVIGEDSSGLELQSHFAASKIGTIGLVRDPARVTSQKCRVVAERQQVVRYDRESTSPVAGKTESQILSHIQSEIKRSDAVILSDYGKGVLTPIILKTAISLSRRAQIPVIVDPKIEHFRRYRQVTCVTPNLNEAWNGMRRVQKHGEEELEKLGRDMIKTLNSDSTLITRGPEGMSLFQKSRPTVHVPAQAREVFDVSGAGDTVIATLTLALASGASLTEAALISNYAAGIVVGKLGTATTTIEEIESVIP